MPAPSPHPVDAVHCEHHLKYNESAVPGSSDQHLEDMAPGYNSVVCLSSYFMTSSKIFPPLNFPELEKAISFSRHAELRWSIRART